MTTIDAEAITTKTTYAVTALLLTAWRRLKGILRSIFDNLPKHAASRNASQLSACTALPSSWPRRQRLQWHCDYSALRSRFRPLEFAIIYILLLFLS